MAHDLELSELAALLPEIDAAEQAYCSALQAAKTDDDVANAAKAYNEVLSKAVVAIHAATAHVNSLDTLEMVFSPKSRYDTYFGISPNTFLRRVVETGSLKGRESSSASDRKDEDAGGADEGASQ